MKLVAFLPPSDQTWMGGVNYYKNLFFALSQNKTPEYRFVAFVSPDIDEEVIKLYEPHVEIRKSSLFKRKSFLWLLERIINRFLGTSPLTNFFLKKHSVDILSHHIFSKGIDCKTVGWIPDFQEMHLPQMFTKRELKRRSVLYHDLSRYSDKVILSSFDALKDFSSFDLEHKYKGEVLQFVSQPEECYVTLADEDKHYILKKYGLRENFFYAPNQFWNHKNHKTLFEAVLILKTSGVNVQVVCSGNLSDERNREHINALIEIVKKHQLEQHIVLPGLIPYKDVFSLIKFSKCVINPSLFEGWSSIVEECKSVGKPMVLSDLDVHHEQYPEALFFARNSPEDLAKTIEVALETEDADSMIKEDDLQLRTEAYARTYYKILDNLNL